eukprot:scaffold3673_cov393-Prasinococcus_capsulatus_cf.AAC.1
MLAGSGAVEPEQAPGEGPATSRKRNAVTRVAAELFVPSLRRAPRDAVATLLLETRTRRHASVANQPTELNRIN